MPPLTLPVPPPSLFHAVFYDRLVDDPDRLWVGAQLTELCEKHFKEKDAKKKQRQMMGLDSSDLIKNKIQRMDEETSQLSKKRIDTMDFKR